MKCADHPGGTAGCALYRNAGPMGARLPAATPAIVVVTEAIVVIPTVIAVITVSMIAIPARSGRGTGEAARVVVVEHLAVVWRLHLIGFDDTLVHQAAIFLRRDGYRPRLRRQPLWQLSAVSVTLNIPLVSFLDKYMGITDDACQFYL